MMLKKGKRLEDINPTLEAGKKYRVKLARHKLYGHPLIEGGKFEEELKNIGYYDEGGAIEDLEIEGPFEFLNIGR